MLVVVVVIFATLWLPYRGMLVYNSFATMHSKPSFMDLWFLMFAKTCVYINRYLHQTSFHSNYKNQRIMNSVGIYCESSAINPILYTAMSIKFRRAFQRILLCGKLQFYFVFSDFLWRGGVGFWRSSKGRNQSGETTSQKKKKKFDYPDDYCRSAYHLKMLLLFIASVGRGYEKLLFAWTRLTQSTVSYLKRALLP